MNETLPPVTISVVTAAYNMADYAGATINSIVSQKQLGDQYIFIDGGSKDDTVEIARRHGAAIDVLVSEPDDGQYHAIAKGFTHATGDVMAWLNADDIYMPWTFSVVREIFARFPDVQWITGSPTFLSESGQLTRIYSRLPAYPRRFIRNGWYSKILGTYLQQESMFWRRSLWEKAGGLDLGLSLAADFELWTRFAEHADLVPVDVPLAAFRQRPGAQRSSAGEDRYESEVQGVCAQKPAAPAWWRWISRQSVAVRSAVRLFITARGMAIAYDRQSHHWRMIERRRAISRLSLGNLLDERLLWRK